MILLDSILRVTASPRPFVNSEATEAAAAATGGVVVEDEDVAVSKTGNHVTMSGAFMS